MNCRPGRLVAIGSLLSLLPIGLAGAFGSERAAAQVPAVNLEVVIAIDTSGSMRPAIEAAKAAAIEFVTSMPPEVPIGVETFGNTVTVLSPPTTDRALLREQIGGIVATGDTALYDAIITATGLFSPAVEQKVIVLLSDGRDDGSRATLEASVASLQGVSVEAISLTTAETDIASLSALGAVTSADDSAGVAAAFARVAGLLAATVEPIAATTTVAPAATAPPTTPPPTTVAVSTTLATTTTEAVATVPPRVIDPQLASTSSEPRSSAVLWLGALGVFAGLFLLGVLFFPRARVSKARLGIEQPRNVSEMGKRTISAVEAALERRGRRDDLATTLAVANISMQPGEFIGLVGVVAVVGALVGLLLGGPVGAVLTAALVCVGATFYVRRAKAKRQAAFAAQLPDVLQLVTTSLRSGFGLAQALDSVAEEAEEPARSAFAQVLVETRLGRDLSDAMRALARRMNSSDLDWVVAAIDINRDTGGNLSEILRTVGSTIRERERMARQVATYTAEGRLSAQVLTLLPIAMALWQWRANPDTFAQLTHGSGLVALIIAGILLVVGTIWTHRIVNSIGT